MRSDDLPIVVIGAGMSGLAAGIRIALYNPNVIIIESHRIPGGLNSYYYRSKRQFDVGLHALTNFSKSKIDLKKSDKNIHTPLLKLLKQLKIPYDAFKLKEQSFSKIIFPDKALIFSNDFELLLEEVKKSFPNEIDNFIKMTKYIKDFNETDLSLKFTKSKKIISSFIKNELLVEMILSPLLIYGSSWENDMDFAQFCIMYKSIYLEGFSRPAGGVKTILKVLEEKFNSLGGTIKYNSKIKYINNNNNKLSNIELESGEILNCKMVFSSAGLVETNKLLNIQNINYEDIGLMSFTETILCYKNTPSFYNENSTISFINSEKNYTYQNPNTSFSNKSAVVCFPNNFDQNENINSLNEGIARITFMANSNIWNNFTKEEYKEEKEKVLDKSKELLQNKFNFNNNDLNYSDVFTPKTIIKYTGKLGGAVYGSTKKKRNGKTTVENVYIIGTDQGFLGIIGSMLSGISITNLYGLL